MSKTLIEVKDLKKHFKIKKGVNLHAVDGLSFKIDQGKTLGMVGESGCGKSTCGRAILRLHEPTSGEILFEGEDLVKLNDAKMREMRKEVQIIFQDPFASLNPRRTVSEIIADPLNLYKVYRSKREVHEKVLEIMDTVGLAERLINAYPHELDGGRRQRIGIARAIALDPKFIVCDEPVSALDVSIQAQILNLLKELQRDKGLTYLFITHDLSVVNYFADDILVMYIGKAVEKASSAKLFSKPMHPYTQALLSAIPLPTIHNTTEKILLKGEVTSPINPKPGCRFAPRCRHVMDKCRTSDPELVEVEKDHFVSCFLYE